MTIKGVIWDFGGVLVRTEDYSRREAMAASLGLTRRELEARVFDAENRRQAQLGGIEGEHHLREVAAEFGITQDELRSNFFADDVLDERLMDYIRSLQPRYQTALLSNALSSLRATLEERFPILDAFDQIIISAEVGLMKPDPAIYALALERLGLQAKQAVFIDDFAENAEGARQAGLHAIHFQSREQTLRDLESLLATA